MTCHHCETAPIFLAFVEASNRWVAFDAQADETAGRWLLTIGRGGKYSARDLGDGSERQRAMRDGIRLYVPHAMRCQAVNR